MNHKVQRRTGFTLVELMVAVVIVAMLAGLTVIGTRVAMKKTKETTVKLQLEQLSMALEKYKNDFGEYPPDFAGHDDDKWEPVMRHVKKRWPRCTYEISQAGYEAFCTDAYNQSGWNVGNFNPASALIFWLGGLPANPNPSTASEAKPSGFYISPSDPLGVSGTTAQREEPRYTFAEGTIRDLDDILANNTKNDIGIDDPAYVPGKTDNKPIAYFNADVREDPAFNYDIQCLVDNDLYPKSFNFGGSLGVAMPYARNLGVWFEPERFQLIHPGQDGVFSDTKNEDTIRNVADLSTLTEGDSDNIVSFAEGATLDSEYRTSK